MIVSERVELQRAFFEILDDRMQLIAKHGQKPELLGSGFGGAIGPTEGLVWIHEKGHLLLAIFTVTGACVGHRRVGCP